MVFRLAFTPCLAETVTVAIASHFLLNFPWLWGFMLGFVLSAVSPAVVVPILLSHQERGFGVAKGIPTLVIAAASVDDVLAISGFTILLGITFKPHQDLLAIVFQGPKEALIGLLFGVGWALLAILLPGKDDDKMGRFRFIVLFLGGLLAYFGSKSVHLDGAGALAVLVLAIVAGIGWRSLGWSNNNMVTSTLADLWVVFQPILFGLIGTEIQVIFFN
jgi:NhaP-type Na+/H+ or K+/H+ antiporter